MPGTDVGEETRVTDPVRRPYVKVVAVPQPPAGTDFTITATEGAVWRVRAVRASLVTSAAVANRTVRLVADDGTSEYFRVRAMSSVVAGATVVHSAFDGSPGLTAVGDTLVMAWPTDGLLLPRGHRLRSLTDLIDVADQWSGVAVLTEIFPEGAGIAWHAGPEPYATEEF